MTVVICAKCGDGIFGNPCLSEDATKTLCKKCRREEIHKSDLEEIWELWDVDRTPKQEERFTSLFARAYGYEEACYPMHDPTPEALIEFWKDQGIIGDSDAK